MPRKVENIVGRKFGLLTVIAQDLSDPRRGSFWVCKCACGGTATVKRAHLTTGHTKGCGCRVGRPSDHGDTHTRFYKIWGGLKERCLNSNSDVYRFYGARGITLCSEWMDYLVFKRDMLVSYQEACVNLGEENVTIDRIDSTKGYYKDNCRWLTRSENTRLAQAYRRGLGVKGA